MRIFIVFFMIGLYGCVNNSTKNVLPRADLSKIKTICVEKFEPDGRGLHLLIADSLAKFSYKASVSNKCEGNVDAVLTYRDKWRWDITMYMLSISMKLSEPDTGFPLAYGQALHTSLTRQTPQETINEVLANIFSKRTVNE
jgi:hypothetical protein